MPLKSFSWVASAVFCVVAAPVGAQAPVYKCAPDSYSQHPCSTRTVNTQEAPVPRQANRAEQNRVLAQSTHRRPGETDGEFQVRRHRVALLRTDREECDRLDTRIPLEQARMTSPVADEVLSAQEALSASKKRFGELRC